MKKITGLLLGLSLCATLPINTNAQEISDNDFNNLFEYSEYNFDDLELYFKETQAIVKDFNKDGTDDLLVCGGKSAFGTCEYFMSVFLGQRDGTMKEVTLTGDPVILEFGSANPIMDVVETENNKYLVAIQGASHTTGASGDWWKDNVMQAAVYQLTFAGNDEFNLELVQNLEHGGGRGSLQFIDVNGDGFYDLTQYGFIEFGNGWSEEACIYINNNNVEFQYNTDSGLPTGANNASNGFMRKADFNKDGKEDLVILNQRGGGNEALVVYFNKGDGTFEPLTITSNLTCVRDEREHMAMNVADVNNDGYPDIIAMCPNEKIPQWAFNVEIWLNDKNGDFTLSEGSKDLMSGQRDCITLADWNLDGNIDMMYCGWNTKRHAYEASDASRGTKCYLCLGKGDGSFDDYVLDVNDMKDENDKVVGAPITPVNGSDGTMYAGDFNGDGKPDLIQMGAINKLYLGKGIPSAINKETKKEIQISLDKNNICIKSESEGIANVYNLTGQQIYSQSIEAGKCNFNLNANNGIYIIEVSNKNSKAQQKIAIK